MTEGLIHSILTADGTAALRSAINRAERLKGKCVTLDACIASGHARLSSYDVAPPPARPPLFVAFKDREGKPENKASGKATRRLEMTLQKQRELSDAWWGSIADGQKPRGACQHITTFQEVVPWITQAPPPLPCPPHPPISVYP